MASRPLVSVYSVDDPSQVEATVPLPAVLTAPIRPDIVSFVHTNLAKNRRQPYAVSLKAGHQTSAESWGTGRAVARIPRVQGGGTQRAGQGAFGNMCRGGRMFAPTKIWRRWHRHVNVNQKRYAVCSALSASAVPALVMARGHRINEVPEVPLVVGNQMQAVGKTKKALEIFEKLGLSADVQRCEQSKQLRTGKGKMRNRRYVLRKGPLVIYDESEGIDGAVRNIPGVECICVDRLNLLQLAPGGHLGRMCVWTQAAFEKLDKLYGTFDEKSEEKSGYSLPKYQMLNADIARIINSDEIQSVVRPADDTGMKRQHGRKKNPLKNPGVMDKINPYAKIVRRAEVKAMVDRQKRKSESTPVQKVKKAKRSKQEKRAFYEAANKEGEIMF